MGGHGVMLHGHEECVEDDADGDGQVHKRVHHDQVDDLLDLYPRGEALPDEEGVGKLVPAWRALPLRFLQLCRTKTRLHIVTQPSLFVWARVCPGPASGSIRT